MVARVQCRERSRLVALRQGPGVPVRLSLSLLAFIRWKVNAELPFSVRTTLCSNSKLSASRNPSRGTWANVIKSSDCASGLSSIMRACTSLNRCLFSRNECTKSISKINKCTEKRHYCVRAVPLSSDVGLLLGDMILSLNGLIDSLRYFPFRQRLRASQQ